MPVVQPDVGAFPELVKSSGGGIIYRGDSAEALANALEPLLRDPGRARALGQAGRQAALKDFEIGTMAQRMAEVYEKIGSTTK